MNPTLALWCVGEWPRTFLAMRKRRTSREHLYESDAYREVVGRLGANVRRIREREGWTQEDAAERCDVSVQLLQRIEAGRTNFTAVTLARLCSGLGSDVRALFLPVGPR